MKKLSTEKPSYPPSYAQKGWKFAEKRENQAKNGVKVFLKAIKIAFFVVRVKKSRLVSGFIAEFMPFGARKIV